MQPELQSFRGGLDVDDGPEARLSEAHHRIANNLAMLVGFVRLQASALARGGQAMSPADGRLMLEEIGARIETVGRLHRLLSLNPGRERIDLGEYITGACEVLGDTICLDRPIELVCDSEGCEATPEKAGLLGLVVTELVTNAVKYAHPAGAPGRIVVRCRRGWQDVTLLTVADDGVGLPDGFDPSRHGGLGLRVVRSLCQQLGAQLDFEADSGVGLTVCVSVPVDGPEVDALPLLAFARPSA